MQEPNTQQGGLVILPSNEKLFKVYKAFQQVSPSLRIIRANNNLAEESATYMSLDLPRYPNNLKIDASKNIARNTEWPLVDILLATPASLCELINLQIKLEIPKVNPKFIVIDQAFTIFS